MNVHFCESIFCGQNGIPTDQLTSQGRGTMMMMSSCPCGGGSWRSAVVVMPSELMAKKKCTTKLNCMNTKIRSFLLPSLVSALPSTSHSPFSFTIPPHQREFLNYGRLLLQYWQCMTRTPVALSRNREIGIKRRLQS